VLKDSGRRLMRIYPKVVTPECFYRGSSHGFVWIPLWNNGRLFKRHAPTMIRIPQGNDRHPLTLPSPPLSGERTKERGE